MGSQGIPVGVVGSRGKLCGKYRGVPWYVSWEVPREFQREVPWKEIPQDPAGCRMGTRGAPWIHVGTRGISPGTPRYPTGSPGIPWVVPRDTLRCRGGIPWHAMIYPRKAAESHGSSHGIPPKTQHVIHTIDQGAKRDQAGGAQSVICIPRVQLGVASVGGCCMRQLGVFCSTT